MDLEFHPPSVTAETAAQYFPPSLRTRVQEIVGDDLYPMVFLNADKKLYEDLKKELSKVPGMGEIRVEELVGEESYWAMTWISHVHAVKTDPEALLKLFSHRAKIRAMFRGQSYRRQTTGNLYNRKVLRDLYTWILGWDD